MAIKQQLYNKKGEEIFPMTSSDCIVKGNRPPQSFIDLWKSLYEGCDYNEGNELFSIDYGNGVKIDDITYEQAILIYKYGTWGNRESILNCSAASIAFIMPQVRATIPSLNNNTNIPYINWTSYKLEVIRYLKPSAYATLVFYIEANRVVNIWSKEIKRFLDYLTPRGVCTIGHIDYTQIYEIYIYKLAYDITLNLTEISLDSLRFLVENAENTNPITVTIPNNVFSKLTNPDNAEWYQLNQDAIAKQITFATA